MNSTEQILQQTLSNWQNWQTGKITLASQPEVLSELIGGKTNHSFLVASGSFKAVVRINAANDSSLGIDRVRERKILQLLQPTGFVPELFFSSGEVLVADYCEGSQWVTADLDDTDNRRAVNHMLKQIQSITVTDLEARNYFNYCTAYINQLDQSLISDSLIEKILLAAAAIDASVWTPVICHHDLVPENIIVTDAGLVLLDWEYAAMGHPALDYIRLYQGDLTLANLPYDRYSINQLEILQRGMDDLWLLVQD